MPNQGADMLEKAMSGFSHYERGNFVEARRIFEELTKLDGNECYYWTALGAVHLAEDSLEQAETALDKALSLNDQELAAYLNRGEVYLRKGLNEKAISDFQRAANLDPKNETPLSARARALAQATEQAISESRK